MFFTAVVVNECDRVRVYARLSRPGTPAIDSLYH